MKTDLAQRYDSVVEFKQALLDYQDHAESITLSQRSQEDLRRACEYIDYDAFTQALSGFRQALVLWDGNVEARNGILETQAEYARCALEKGDLDLAASMLDSSCPAHTDLIVEVEDAQLRRAAAKQRLQRFRIAAISLTAAVILILTIASIWIYGAKQQADAAREDAVAAQRAEAEQRDLAVAAMAKAQDEEARAVAALAQLEQAYADLVEAQEQERQAWALARESERVATETRDELAKTGMLLDNSWWVFDASTARKRQQSATDALGMPVESVIPLTNETGLTMVLIPPGEFVMGSPPDEENRAADEHLHRISHSAAFFLGKFELTEAQWQAATGQPPPNAVNRAADPTLPVTGVSYAQIREELLPGLRQHAPDGYEFRLPTEAEWEYACRAGTGAAYSTGDDPNTLPNAAWFQENSDRKVQPVGGKQPNAWGLCDMHGNAGEVCADAYAPGFYLDSPTDDPLAAFDSDKRVVRGGSALNTPAHCRSAYRSYVYSKNEYPFLGLRLALVPVRQNDPELHQSLDEISP